MGITNPELINLLNKCYSLSKRYPKIVIWGLKSELHTHRYIHKSFYETLQKLKIPSIWVDDTIENNTLINKDDLVFAMTHTVVNIKYRKDVVYCLHNVENKPTNITYLDLQIFYNGALEKSNLEQLEASTFFHKETKMLYQPWGTDLLPGEFMPPIFNANSQHVYWVGSIWNNKYNQGNLEEMKQLKETLKKRQLQFVHKENVSLSDNIQFMRQSRITPAIGGEFQVKVNYLPCRFYKNISYGCLGMSNIEFLNSYNFGMKNTKDISSLLDNALQLNETSYLEVIKQQQHYTELHHTYVSKLIMIFESLNKLY